MTEPHLIGNRYELGALIGYGGMAEVHMGRDVRLGRQVALKVLRADLARDPSFQTRFRREAQSAGGLNHPSIVAVYDTGEDHRPDGMVPFIVMEYVDGRTLRDVLSSERRLDPTRAMEIVSEICSALDFSHRNGIVHRDIKPANVMITRAGAVKVMDFGIARAVADSAATVTQTAAVIGTAQYLSPEQARGEAVDARSDVYSTGCLLYELLTGQPPFQGDSPVAVAYQHVRESAPVPSSLNPAVPRALDSIVMKALAKNPVNRYQTAADMRADLQRAIAEQPVNAEPVLSDDERTQLIARSSPAPAARRMADSGPIQMKDDDDTDRTSRSGALLWAAAVLVLLLVIAGGAYALLHGGSKKKATPPPATVTVPKIVGMTVDAGTAALTKAQLVLKSSDTQQVNTCAVTVQVGQICTQDPADGQTVNVGTSVTISVYAGPETVTVPSVIGLSFTDAQKALAAVKLQAQPQPIHNSAAVNTVVAANPAAGQKVGVNSVVVLQVADGKVQIPDVSRAYDFAGAAAKLNGVNLLSVAQSDQTVPTIDKTLDGKVARTSPAAGTWVAQGTATNIVVYVYKYVPPLPACPKTSPSTGGQSSTPPSPPASGSSTSPSTSPSCTTAS